MKRLSSAVRQGHRGSHLAANVRQQVLETRRIDALFRLLASAGRGDEAQTEIAEATVFLSTATSSDELTYTSQ